jgi:hypothetical protein
VEGSVGGARALDEVFFKTQRRQVAKAQNGPFYENRFTIAGSTAVSYKSRFRGGDVVGGCILSNGWMAMALEEELAIKICFYKKVCFAPSRLGAFAFFEIPPPTPSPSNDLDF